MHFLCLHGRGTNSNIFEMQTAAIRYELGDHHTYDFVEGNMPWEIVPEMKSMMPSEHEAFTYYDYYSPETAVKALRDFEAFLKTDGPYDGVMAFSQGVTLVGTWMIHQLKQLKPIESTFKCAIFFSAPVPPADYMALHEDRLVQITSAEAGEIIGIPTAHVWGREDEWADAANDFSKVCKTENRSLFIHGGGHEIPGPGSKEAVTKSVNVIRRAIHLSESVALPMHIEERGNELPGTHGCPKEAKAIK